MSPVKHRGGNLSEGAVSAGGYEQIITSNRNATAIIQGEPGGGKVHVDYHGHNVVVRVNNVVIDGGDMTVYLKDGDTLNVEDIVLEGIGTGAKKES